MSDFCPGCSREVDEEAAECPYCGWKFPQAAAKPRKEDPVPSPEPERIEVLEAGTLHSEGDEFGPRKEKKTAFQKIAPYVYSALGTIALVAVLFNRREIKYINKTGINIVNEDERIVAISTAPVVPPEPPSTLALAKNIPAKEPRFTVEGNLFEIATLKPAAGVKMTYLDRETKERYHTLTNSKGYFRGVLPVRETGFLILMRHPDFFKLNYVEDWLPSIRSLGEGRREAVAEDLLSQPEAAEILYGTRDKSVKKDYGIVMSRRRFTGVDEK